MFMFKDAPVFSSFSVNDIPEAEHFYSKLLGLKTDKTPMGGLMLLLSGGGEIYLYPKDNHEPATFTVLNLEVEDIEKAVDDLTNLGIKFEIYGGDIRTDEKGILRGGKGPKGIAWFKDPAGNILSVIQEK